MNVKIYGIDRDNGDGRYVRRYVFARLDPPSINHADDRGLVTHNDSDAGFAGTLLAPEGSRLDGEALVLPDGTRLSADESLAAARESKPWLRMGLEVIPD